jgi:hypothetical protein
MTITAKFTNGFEDTYKGNRAVKAAWAIIRKSDGEVLASGHSLDASKAAKTASGHMMYLAHAVGVDLPRFDVPQRIWSGANYSYLFSLAAKYGYAGKAPHMSAYKRWAIAKNAERRAAVEAAVSVEIINL